MPLVLHAAHAEAALVLWGEAEAVGRRGRRAAPAAPPHPRAADGAGLRAALGAALGCAVSGEEAREAEFVAWLPSSPEPEGPWPSPGLGAVPQDGPCVLRPWRVPALVLGADAAAALLQRCAAGTGLPADVVPAPDLLFWTAPYRLAARLGARGALLPSVGQGPGGFRAAWTPLLSPGERDDLDQWAKAMPPACRALAAELGHPPAVDPAGLLDAVLRALVDRLPRAPGGAPAGGTIHDRWLAGLAGQSAALDGPGAEVEGLARAVGDWAAPVAARHEAYRLCFRLDEPPEGGAQWHVRYVLQAVDDPSLLVEAERVWAAPRGAPAGGRPALLAALGRAAALVPEVERSLQGNRPAGYALDTAGAHAFLTETAPLLEQAGFGLMLPGWWTGRGRPRLVARAHARPPKMAAASGLGLGAVVEFDWTVAMGDETLTREELERLASLKAPLVAIRGRWVQVGAAEIQAALALWDGRAPRRGTVGDALRLAAGSAPSGLGPLPAELAGAEGWIGDLLGRTDDGAFGELAPPGGLRATLRPYQLRGYSWLDFLAQRGLGACLADDMGLGKTVQTLAFVVRDWEAHRRPVLLVCPTSVLGNWRKEIERFAPDLPVLLHHGADRVRDEGFAASVRSSAMVLTTYALLVRDAEALRAVPWRAVVLDEAQNVKNAETKQAQAARALPADCRIALTGTPVENSVGDLWSLMEFLNPGLLGGQADFRRRFFTPIQVDRDAGAAERLRRLTGPFVLRRLKTDPSIQADLPAKNEMTVYCTLTREQASLYGAVVADLEGRLAGDEPEGGIGRRGQILAALSKLKQVCNHPAHFLGDGSPLPGRSGKLERLVDMLREALATGDRALIFTQFTEMGTLLQQHLHRTLGCEVLFLHGGLSRTSRDAMVDAFQRPGGGPPLFVLSLKAGGTGLNLTAANRVFHFDRWWNPAVENQATDRAFRLGQRRDVQVHKFVCAGTLEERIDRMIEAKREVAERVVGTGEAWLTELSTAELRDLLALRPEAVEE